MSFDGCELDKAYIVEGYIFICSKHDYDYEYGEVILVSKDWKYKDNKFTSSYLCTEKECYKGTIYKK
jgi:hypothetical protein